MTSGVPLFRLYQRKTADGDACFFGTMGDALVSMARDHQHRDVWIVSVHSPSQDSNSKQAHLPARLDFNTLDDLDWTDGDSVDDGDFDDLPADCMTLPSHGGER